MKRIGLLMVIALFVFTLMGCVPKIKTEDGSISFKDGKIEIESDDGTAVISGDGENFNIETEDGDMTIEDGEIQINDDDSNSVFQANEDGVDLPEGYPKDLVPLVGDAKITMSNRQDVGDGKIGFMIMYTTTEDYEDVTTFYKDLMADAENKVTTEGSEMLFAMGVLDNQVIDIKVTPEEDGVLVAIVISPEE